MVNSSMIVGVVAYLCTDWVPLLLVLIAPGLVLRIGIIRMIPMLPGGMMLVLALSGVTFFTFDLLSGLLIEPPYGLAFDGPTMTPARALLRSSFRLLVLYLPLLSIVAAVTLVVQQPDALLQFPWPEVALAVISGVVFFGRWLRAWLVPARPMEQTAWMALAPRIREWARCACTRAGGWGSRTAWCAARGIRYCR